MTESSTHEGRLRLVVPSERHVERLVRRGHAAETRASLERRLLEACAPEVVLATPEETRLVLAEALRGVALGDALLEPLYRAGSVAWLRTIDAVDDALGVLRTADVSMTALEAMERRGGAAGRRAAMLRRASEVLDHALSGAGLVDARAAGRRLATALGKTHGEDLAAIVGATRVVSRFIVTWEPRDLVWWKTLDAVLHEAGGSAQIELPSFQKQLDAERDRDPLEVLMDDVARALDELPGTHPIDAVLGDLRLEGKDAMVARLELAQASDAHAQARAVADAVSLALESADIESIAVAVPRIDEETLGPLRLALDEAGLKAHDARGPAPTSAPIVAAALEAHAIASRGLPRHDVAALVRSHYIDRRRLTGTDDGRESRRQIHDLARALERTPTVAASDAVTALEATARGDVEEGVDPRADERARLARRIGELLWTCERATTRSEHVRVARQLWNALGFPARAGYDAKTTLASDVAPVGIARAELHALARDAHAWEVLNAALDAYEAAVVRMKLGRVPASSEVFRHELARALEAGAPPPGAGKVGAIRIGRLPELAAEPLACLVVIDVNEGVLPSALAGDPLVSDALAAGLREIHPVRSPPSPSLRAARELGALALAVSHADKIVLVHRARAEDGSALAPAPLIAWLERAGARTSHWHGSPLAGRPLSVADARLRALASDEAGRAALAPGATRRARIELLRESFHGKARANNAAARERTTSLDPKRIDEDDLIGWLQSKDEALRAALTAETGGSERALPVTALEHFAQCAFQGFALQVLRARDVERREDTPDAREEGSLIHDALAAAFRATAALWRDRPRDRDAIRTLALEAADLSLQRDRAASMLRRIALDQAREDVARVVEWSLGDLDWDFEHAEQPFGDPRVPDGWPALVLTEGGATLTLTGKIDRVDVGHDDPLRVRAIDYKRTATKVAQFQKELGTTALQVPLYAQVAAETLKRPDLSGLYLPSAKLDPAYAPPAAFSAKWRELFERARESGEDGVSPLVLRAVGLVRSIRDGSLAPLPHDERACDYCRIDAACRRPRFVVSDEDVPEGEPS